VLSEGFAAFAFIMLLLIAIPTLLRAIRGLIRNFSRIDPLGDNIRGTATVLSPESSAFLAKGSLKNHLGSLGLILFVEVVAALLTWVSVALR
jgi:hypothetical protein